MIHTLDLLGVAVFAVTGSLFAARKGMDVFGVVLVAVATALGGGTLRDMLLGIRPVFWVSDPVYVAIAGTAGIITFTLSYVVRLPGKTLLVLDALGLGAFTVIGCRVSLNVDTHYLICPLMGMMTGVAGGIVRDVMCGGIPLILHKEVYATVSLLGGLVYVIMLCLGVNDACSGGIAICTVVVLRLIVVYRKMSLPRLVADNLER